MIEVPPQALAQNPRLDLSVCDDPSTRMDTNLTLSHQMTPWLTELLPQHRITLLKAMEGQELAATASGSSQQFVRELNEYLTMQKTLKAERAISMLQTCPVDCHILICVQVHFTPDQDQQAGTLGKTGASCQCRSFDVHPGRLYCRATESHNGIHVKLQTQPADEFRENPQQEYPVQNKQRKQGIKLGRSVRHLPNEEPDRSAERLRKMPVGIAQWYSACIHETRHKSHDMTVSLLWLAFAGERHHTLNVYSGCKENGNVANVLDIL
ncbi:mCG53541 [Mus musculus]|nr:mCG53541 [Mus musculus]